MPGGVWVWVGAGVWPAFRGWPVSAVWPVVVGWWSWFRGVVVPPAVVWVCSWSVVRWFSVGLFFGPRWLSGSPASLPFCLVVGVGGGPCSFSAPLCRRLVLVLSLSSLVPLSSARCPAFLCPPGCLACLGWSAFRWLSGFLLAWLVGLGPSSPACPAAVGLGRAKASLGFTLLLMHVKRSCG